MYGLASSGSGYRPVAFSCEYDSELPCSRESEEFTDHTTDDYFRKNNFAPSAYYWYRYWYYYYYYYYYYCIVVVDVVRYKYDT
jgi:hypothetical protein